MLCQEKITWCGMMASAKILDLCIYNYGCLSIVSTCNIMDLYGNSILPLFTIPATTYDNCDNQSK